MPSPNYPQFESHFLAFMNSLDTNAAYRFENTKVFIFCCLNGMLNAWKKKFFKQFRLLDSLQSVEALGFCRFASPLCPRHCTWSIRKLNKSWNRCLFCSLMTLIESLWQLNWMALKETPGVKAHFKHFCVRLRTKTAEFIRKGRYNSEATFRPWPF